jgi:hypothetical protein
VAVIQLQDMTTRATLAMLAMPVTLVTLEIEIEIEIENPTPNLAD